MTIFRILNIVTILLLLGCSAKPIVYEALLVPAKAKASNSTSSHLKSEQNDAKQQFALGVKYEDGDGVPQSYIEAAKWYRLAANQGDADAQCSLGERYYNGQGVPP